MQWSEELIPERRRITGIKRRMEDNVCVLTWQWPEEIKFVYIYGFEPDHELPLAERPQHVMKLYTREEYKAKSGYREYVEAIGRYSYRVYPCVQEEGKVLVLKQEDADNSIRFATGKAAIRYSIKYGGGLFSKRKTVRMELRSEVFVPKEALCYVKKEGSFPLNKGDGILYPFIDDVAAGRNALPIIEVNKRDQIKIFFTDGKKYGELYELIPD